MSWLNLTIDPDIFWVVMKKIMQNPNQNNRTSNRELEPRTHGLESQAVMVKKNLNKRGNVLVNVTFGHVPVTIVAVESNKYYIL